MMMTQLPANGTSNYKNDDYLLQMMMMTTKTPKWHGTSFASIAICRFKLLLRWMMRWHVLLDGDLIMYLWDGCPSNTRYGDDWLMLSFFYISLASMYATEQIRSRSSVRTEDGSGWTTTSMMTTYYYVPKHQLTYRWDGFVECSMMTTYYYDPKNEPAYRRDGFVECLKILSTTYCMHVRMGSLFIIFGRYGLYTWWYCWISKWSFALVLLLEWRVSRAAACLHLLSWEGRRNRKRI